MGTFWYIKEKAHSVSFIECKIVSLVKDDPDWEMFKHLHPKGTESLYVVKTVNGGFIGWLDIADLYKTKEDAINAYLNKIKGGK